MSLESDFQSKFIKKLKERFPGCLVLKNDPNYIQGIPDLTLLTEDGWALLEAKRDSTASHRPNQDYYVKKASSMQFGSFVYPENEEEVINGIQKTFERKRGGSRISRS